MFNLRISEQCEYIFSHCLYTVLWAALKPICGDDFIDRTVINLQVVFHFINSQFLLFKINAQTCSIFAPVVDVDRHPWSFFISDTCSAIFNVSIHLYTLQYSKTLSPHYAVTDISMPLSAWKNQTTAHCPSQMHIVRREDILMPLVVKDS
jgi:hypothetical protein